MRNRGRRRNAGRRLSSVGAGVLDPKFVILTITESVGESLVTTAAPHGLASDTPIVVSGTSVAGYNGPHTVTVISDTTFTLQGFGYSGDSAGGTWALG